MDRRDAELIPSESVSTSSVRQNREVDQKPERDRDRAVERVKAYLSSRR